MTISFQIGRQYSLLINSKKYLGIRCYQMKTCSIFTADTCFSCETQHNWI